MRSRKKAFLQILNAFQFKIKNIWVRCDSSFVKKTFHTLIAVQLLSIKFYLFIFSNIYFLFINNKLADFISIITLPLVFGLVDRGIIIPTMLYLLLIFESTIFYYVLKSVPGAQEWFNRSLTPDFVHFFCDNTSFFKGSQLAVRIGLYYVARTGDTFVTNQAVSDLAEKQSKFLESAGEKLSIEERNKIWEAAQKEVGRGFIRNIENTIISTGSESLKGLGDISKKIGEVLSKKD